MLTKINPRKCPLTSPLLENIGIPVMSTERKYLAHVYLCEIMCL